MQKQPKIINVQRGNTLIQDRAVNAIFGNSLVEGTIAKGRTNYVCEARRINYLGY